MRAAADDKGSYRLSPPGGAVVLSRLADAVVPVFGRLDDTTDAGFGPIAGSVIIANHTSLSDPAVVLATCTASAT